MSLSTSRMLLRTPQVGRMTLRHASTTSEAANAASSKAKETAASATSSASQGLSKVSTTASSGLSKAGQVAGNTLNSIGGRTGKLIGFVQCTSTSSRLRPAVDLTLELSSNRCSGWTPVHAVVEKSIGSMLYPNNTRARG